MTTVIQRVDILDEYGQVTRDRTVVVVAGSIQDILPGDSPIPERYRVLGGEQQDTEIVSGVDRVLTPGLVNLHTHSPMNVFRGIAEDVNEQDWFNREIWPYESNMTREDVRLGARLAVAEMISCGVTAFADHYFMADEVCSAAADAGIRLDMAPTLFGLSGDFPDQLRAAEELLQSWQGFDGRIAVRLGPHSFYTCDEQQVRMCVRSAERLGAGLHIHISETAGQVAAARKQYGTTPFGLLERTGALDLPLIIGHGIFLEEEDHHRIRYAMKEHSTPGERTALAVCPITYLKLGSGTGNLFAAYDTFVKQGEEPLPLAIGTDGAASSNSLDPLAQTRLLALLGKAHAGDGAAWSAEQAWRIHMAGHDALPFGSGRIAVGAPADLVLWDLHTINTIPVYRPLSAMLYSSSPVNITDVWIAGRRVKREGVVCIETPDLYQEARERVGQLLARGRGPTNLVF